jgi:hypothetical protein
VQFFMLTFRSSKLRNFMKKYLLALCSLLTAFMAKAQQPAYNYYYGNLHAHSAYSDGNKDASTSGSSTPFQNYVYANASLHFDFLGISEHNHAGAGMQKVNYAKGLRQADSATVNGQFVALYGMEWGVISGGGHILVYGVDKLLGWESNNYDVFVAKSDYQSLFRQINKRPGAFATLAHPQTGDYGNLAGSATAFSQRADSAIVGTVMRSGPAFSTNFTYSNNSTGSYETSYLALLAKGYHIGISLDHDNHNTTFGRTTGSRVVVLALSLTKTDIMQAFRERRFYASDDWNTQVNFTLNNQPIGSIFQGANAATINVTVSDVDNESVKSIYLMKGTPGSGQNAVPVSTTGVGVSALSYVDNAASGNFYYYAIIIQSDGDRIVTSPIWYNRSSVAGLAPESGEMALNVFPNPATEHNVTVSYFLKNQGIVTAEVLDALGRQVLQWSGGEMQAPGSHSYEISTQDLNAGMYTIRILNNGAVTFRKLVVTK